jgi:hypothetical protein
MPAEKHTGVPVKRGLCVFSIKNGLWSDNRCATSHTYQSRQGPRCPGRSDSSAAASRHTHLLIYNLISPHKHKDQGAWEHNRGARRAGDLQMRHAICHMPLALDSRSYVLL